MVWKWSWKRIVSVVQMGVELAEQICVFVQMGVELEEKVNKEVQDVIQYASGPWPSEMKSIRGLEERLYGLDKLVHSAETTVEAQVNTTKVCEWGKGVCGGGGGGRSDHVCGCSHVRVCVCVCACA